MEQTFAALADPTRLGIVMRLAETGEIDATDLARPFAISAPAVSRHLKVLEQAGWVTRRRIGTRRPVRLDPARLDEVQVWTGRLRAALAANYARLDALLDSEKDNP
ncbi:metalloregulator ArsR/SmtB family transcription factor [Thalassococcus sp. CAU 1522]|uniref:Metalloregulator ArsR/SmtB family transcription factor n=1 Tax=Thalassococcus arenae TaxID=2851652 RepID=A0ABS6N563_9RHOB|nr:metalloregulator ArsR/SmtB family transcription factor [Thalassococcus arenae]MBV2358817.1 metalloregulator ArsR/SmtB family transcription factor [Thalassococcus arenae]